MFMDDDSKNLNKTILDIKNNNGDASKGYGGSQQVNTHKCTIHWTLVIT
jgi:hypothetical protein